MPCFAGCSKHANIYNWVMKELLLENTRLSKINLGGYPLCGGRGQNWSRTVPHIGCTRKAFLPCASSCVSSCCRNRWTSCCNPPMCTDTASPPYGSSCASPRKSHLWRPSRRPNRYAPCQSSGPPQILHIKGDHVSTHRTTCFVPTSRSVTGPNFKIWWSG